MTAPDPDDRPAEDLPGGPLAWMSGPEHLQEADMLLSGYRRIPHKWSDRIAAAGVHVQAAQVQLLAMMMISSHADDTQLAALRSHWMGVLRVPPDVDAIDEMTSRWAGHGDEYGQARRRAGLGDDDEQGSDA